jgi:hypothetical protein
LDQYVTFSRNVVLRMLGFLGNIDV